jgi:hypothetical protein
VKIQVWSRGVPLLFFNLDIGWDEGQLYTPTAFPQGMTQYLLYRKLGGSGVDLDG